MSQSARRLGLYLLIGIYFGLVLTKSEAISWYRIQEMFRFQAFHMYGIIGSALAVGLISIQVIKRLSAKDLDGLPITIPDKELGSGTRYWLGGTIFGLGWALTGACPGPMFALVGAGLPVMLIAVLSAVAGTWVYGALRTRLPH
ncbi:MAG: YeeE/YedE family protein [Rhodothermales bacterium]|nr:YeeE/YedE family protein [Rhodothermales bacterium]MBO6778842.1 YeeE/YedE family protein [Rhodothermales bacterium]